MAKIFVIDTNVLLHTSNALHSFSDNDVVLPMTVIEELDKFKKNNDELGRNARHIIRCLDKLRAYGSLKDGVSLKHLSNGHNATGILQIVTGDGTLPGLLMDVPDNRILRVAYNLFKEGKEIVFVSKDINVRLKADALGLTAEDFEKEKVNVDEIISGESEITVSYEQINSIYEKKELLLKDYKFNPNEFVLLVDEKTPKHTALCKSDSNNILRKADIPDHAWNVKPRNLEQSIALELLMNPDIQIVTLMGQAGTGKTLLAIAAGLESVMHNNLYEKILVSRPIIPMGKDIGYLPGDKDAKLTQWMQPIFDNLEFLMQTKKHTSKEAHKEIEELMHNKKLELEALTYIRGRSIPKQYVVIDEAQNLTPHEVKTIISRAGEGTKLVLTGDPYQIDNPYLDISSNGLAYVVERLKNQAIHGHVTLRKSERSLLAGIAAEYL